MDPKDPAAYKAHNNPKGIYGEPVIKDAYVPNNWDESKGALPQSEIKTRPTEGYRHVLVQEITRNDGTKEQWLQDSNSAPVMKLRDLTTRNEARAEAWEKAITQSGTQGRADQSISARTITKVNPEDGKVHVYRFDPEADDYTIDLGVAGTASQNVPSGTARTPEGAEREAQQKVERERNQAQYGVPFDDIQLREWLDAKEKEKTATTERERAAARQAVIDAENKATNDFNKQQTLLKNKQDAETLALNKNKPIAFNGKMYRPEYAEDGVTVIGLTEIPGAEGPGGTDFGTIRLEAGNITSTMLDAFSKANARRIRGEITADQMKEELDPIFQAGNTRINEINGIISTQRGIYQDESANYRQQVTAATSLLNNAFSPSRQARGSLVAGDAALAELAIGAQYLDMFAPRPKLGVGAEQAKGIGLQTIEFDTNTGKLTIGGGPAGGPVGGTAGGPPSMDNPLAMGMAQQAASSQARDQTFNQIKDDPFFAPVLDQFIKTDPSFRVTDQIRAPGFSEGMPDPMATAGL